MAQESWIVDLNLNLNTFRRDLASAKNLLKGVTGTGALGGLSGISGSAVNLGKGIADSIARGFKGQAPKIKNSLIGPIQGILLGAGFAIANFNKQMTQRLTSHLKKVSVLTRVAVRRATNMASVSGSSAASNLMVKASNLAIFAKNKLNTRSIMGNKNLSDFQKFIKITSLVAKNINVLAGTSLVGLGAKLTAANGKAGILARTLVTVGTALAKLPPQVTGSILAVVAGIAVTFASAFGAALLQIKAMNFATPFVQAFADVEKLRNGLIKVGLTAAQVKETLNMGKLPGLTRAGAAEGISKMVASGFSFEASQEIIKQFSKVTGSADEYSRVMTALSQIMSKSELSAEEVNNQLSEAIPGFKKYLKQAFGVSTAEQLRELDITPEQFVAGMTKELSKIQAPASTAQSSLDNLGDAMVNLKASVGAGLSAGGFDLFLTKLVGGIDALVASGKLEELGRELGSLFNAEKILQMTDAVIMLAKSLKYLVAIAEGSLGIMGILVPLLSGLGGASKIAIKGARDAVKPEPLFSKISKDLATQDTLKGMGGETSQSEALNLQNMIQEKQLNALREIAKNTDDKALERSIMGGGNLGAKGIGALDLGGGGTSGMGAEVDAKMKDLLNAIARTVRSTSVTAGGFSR